MSPKGKAEGQKAAATRRRNAAKRGRAVKKAALTRKRRTSARKVGCWPF